MNLIRNDHTILINDIVINDINLKFKTTLLCPTKQDYHSKYYECILPEFGIHAYGYKLIDLLKEIEEQIYRNYTTLVCLRDEKLTPDAQKVKYNILDILD